MKIGRKVSTKEVFCFSGQASNHCFSRAMTERGCRFGYRSHLTQSWCTAVSQQCLISRGRAELSLSVSHHPLSQGWCTLQFLEEFPPVTLFPCKPNSHPGEMVGLHQERAPVCAQAPGSHCTGWRGEQLSVGL